MHGFLLSFLDIPASKQDYTTGIDVDCRQIKGGCQPAIFYFKFGGLEHFSFYYRLSTYLSSRPQGEILG